MKYTGNGMESLEKKLSEIKKRQIAVGFPKGKCQAYPDGTSVIDVATQHVFGIGVPERNFMEMAEKGIRKKTKPILRAIYKSDNQTEVGSLQNMAGQVAADEIKRAIVELTFPPNSPITIAKKGSDNPLIDTTHMLHTVTYVVRKRK